ncbi:MAG: N-6 DNA methylase [Kiritimatiellia bacterium]|jgi:type I restriction enzyme M protein
MSTKPQELNKVIADLRQIIVGKVAMPTDQIEQITLFLFLKQLSRKHDDLVRIGSKELIFTGAWERYHFDVLMRHSGEELVKECREAVESLYKNPHIDATVRKVFERSYLKILEPKVLSSFLQYLNDKFSDGLDLGDFYESLLPILGTQNELGQFRTPRHIIDFIVRVVDPNIGEKIADPACGTAGFLVAAFNYLKGKYTDEKGRLKLNPEQTKKLYNETIFGWDMEPLMVKFSLANLYLHGLKVPNVSENDTLLNENLWQHTFDIIVANPPFITPKGGARRHSRFAITSNKTEVLFCEYMVHHLNFNGRMGIIVPEGIIFDASKGHQAIRKLFLDNGLWCVVSLPQKVFNPYSPVKTSIVFLDKTLKPDQILFYEIENHGFTLNTNPAPIDKNDLPNALEVIKKYREDLQNGKQPNIDDEKFYTIASKKIIESNTTNLTGGVHREKKIKSNGAIPMIELGQVCEIYQPKTITSKEIKESGKYKVYGANGVIGFYDKYNHEEQEILVTCRGATCGTINFSEPQSWVTGNAMVVHPKDEKVLNQRYLYFVLESSDLSKTITGAAQPQITRASLSPFKIPLPPLEIQDQIVGELENYQKVIDGARAVVESWKPSFEIDPRWEIVKLKELADLQNGFAFKSDDYVEKSEVLNFRMSNIRPDGSVDVDYNPKYLPNSFYEKYKDFALFDGDVVIAMTDMAGDPKILGVPTIVDSKGKKLLLNQRVGKFKDIKIDRLSIPFLKYVLQRDVVKEYYKKLGGGGVQINIGKDNILSIEIPLPPLEIQKQIVAKIEEERKVVEANKKLIDLFQQKIEAKIKSIYG